MEKDLRTPGPWHVISDRARSVTLGLPTVVSIGTDPDNLDGFDVPVRNKPNGYSEAKANAAFIVRACNSHDALVKALEALVRKLEGPNGTVAKFPLLVAEARAALALAKEA